MSVEQAENLIENLDICIFDKIFSQTTRGTCIIITPAVLVLHKYPIDCWRINPDFYEEYCKRRNLKILYEHFEYIGREKVQENKVGSDYYYPSPSPNKFKTLWSRIIHKLFNTYGRSMFFPWHVTIGVIIKNEKP